MQLHIIVQFDYIGGAAEVILVPIVRRERGREVWGGDTGTQEEEGTQGHRRRKGHRTPIELGGGFPPHQLYRCPIPLSLHIVHPTPQKNWFERQILEEENPPFCRDLWMLWIKSFWFWENCLCQHASLCSSSIEWIFCTSTPCRVKYFKLPFAL